MLARIADRFDSSLHAPVAELLEIGQHAHVDVPLGSRHVDVNGVEVIPTPGHSPGSTCYLVDGAEGRYLFTGDTLVLGDSGDWWAGYIPGIGDADALATSLRLLRTLDPRRGDLQRIPRRLGRAQNRAWPLAGARRPGSRRPVRGFDRPTDRALRKACP